MNILFPYWIFRIILLWTISISSSCGVNKSEGQTDLEKGIQPVSPSYFDECDGLNFKKEVFVDTIQVGTAEELRNNIKSNRILKLTGNHYRLKSTLQIDSIHNLKIIGGEGLELKIVEKNATVIHLVNAQNIYFKHLIIGPTKKQEFIGPPGILRVEHSSNVNISDCKILGYGSFGFITSNVCDLEFKNSEITGCTALIFELEKSRKFEFEKVKFHNNQLGISVLGGFTNSTKEITFADCEFLNNTPEMTGNPAFNFRENYTNFDEKIIFSNCTFKNNKGYKWYGDKIQLENCKIDSTDFIGLQRMN